MSIVFEVGGHRTDDPPTRKRSLSQAILSCAAATLMIAVLPSFASAHGAAVCVTTHRLHVGSILDTMKQTTEGVQKKHAAHPVKTSKR